MKELGEWAAAKLGLSGRGQEAYVAELRKKDIIGDEASVIEKLKADFSARSIGCTEAEIREFITTARIKAEDELCKQP